MKKLYLLLLPLLILSCTGVSEGDIKKINGYWEIETAVMPDGSEKEYKVNPTIDYFELKGRQGFRKKVMPQMDGTYLTGDNYEKISISTAEGKTYLNYTTDYAKWKEEIVELNDEELVLKNTYGMEYHYKKPVPFSVKK
ncbi:hypothetical protein CHU92_10030 [Flavobacterium cyanobacteriorum]|uniref:Lipocalin-like domain-containing protein n=1 Tax=Flavobacterium cyanobacteriorum TaxID=2022802 RepID=A0A255Z3R8_9FLAO|nr:lipocalin family protein [Flavobacterium cyanobacteriorum]OYQ36118.1 hypothetical protein CHU92_10030 [Flavobacterium cyanobacteriorum]